MKRLRCVYNIALNNNSFSQAQLPNMPILRYIHLPKCTGYTIKLPFSHVYKFLSLRLYESIARTDCEDRNSKFISICFSFNKSKAKLTVISLVSVTYITPHAMNALPALDLGYVVLICRMTENVSSSMCATIIFSSVLEAYIIQRPFSSTATLKYVFELAKR